MPKILETVNTEGVFRDLHTRTVEAVLDLIDRGETVLESGLTFRDEPQRVRALDLREEVKRLRAAGPQEIPRAHALVLSGLLEYCGRQADKSCCDACDQRWQERADALRSLLGVGQAPVGATR